MLGYRLNAAGLASVLLLAFALRGQDSKGSQASDGPELVSLNSKLSAIYGISRFETKLGTCTVSIDPYFGRTQTPKSDLISYEQTVTYKDTIDEGGTQRQFDVASKTTARINATTGEVAVFVYEYTFMGQTVKAAYDAAQSKEEIMIQRGDKPERLPFKGSDPKVVLGFSPELAFIQLAHKKKLNLTDESRHRILLVLPSEKELILKEVQFRVVNPEVRRYIDQLMNVFHVAPEPDKDFPAFMSLRHCYVDGYGRVLEFSTSDETHVSLASETQFTRIDKPVDTWYKNVYVIPQSQEEKQIGYMFTKITPRAETGYDYTAERVIKRVILDVIRDLRETWTISLRPDLSVESLTYERTFANTGIKAVYDRRNKKVTYTAMDPTAPPKVVDVASEETFYGTMDLAVFILAQKEELLKANVHSALVLNPEYQEVQQIAIQLKGATRRDYLGGKIYTLQTQVSVEDLVRAEIYLDKYGRALEVSLKEAGEGDALRDGLRAIVTKSDRTAKEGVKEATPASANINPFRKRSQDAIERRPSILKLRVLVTAFTKLRRVFEEMAKNQDDPLRLSQLFPGFEESYEGFGRALAEYKDSLQKNKDSEMDPRVPGWEAQAKKWREKVDEWVPRKKQYAEKIRAMVEQIKRLLQQRNLNDAKKEITKARDMIKESDLEDADRQTFTDQLTVLEELIKDIEDELKLEQVVFDIPAIAWELDNVERPVRVTVDLFGFGLDLIDSLKVIRVRAYAVIDGKIQKEGDEILTKPGLKVKIIKIQKDKITVEAGKNGKFKKDFFMRQ